MSFPINEGHLRKVFTADVNVGLLDGKLTFTAWLAAWPPTSSMMQ